MKTTKITKNSPQADWHASVRRAILALMTVGGLLQSVPAAPLLIVRDGKDDRGSIPYAGKNPVYASVDIGVQQTPNPAYDPRPYRIGHCKWNHGKRENPIYRDPRLGRPNYIYIRVRNLGDTASTGQEALRVYWAKPSLGQSWSPLGPGPRNQWEDFVTKAGEASRLFGSEITLGRRSVLGASESIRALFQNALAQSASGDFAFTSGTAYQETVALIPPRVLRGWDGKELMSPQADAEGRLRIPVLQPGYEVIMEVPYFPPNPDMVGGDRRAQHYCLLARIESTETYPFGMPTAEVQGSATRNAGDDPPIAQYNGIIIVDDGDTGWRMTGGGGGSGPAGVLSANGELVHNSTDRAQAFTIALTEKDEESTASSLSFGRMKMTLDMNLFNKWVEGGRVGVGVTEAGPGEVFIESGRAELGNIVLAAREIRDFGLTFALPTGYRHPEGQVFVWDVEQRTTDGRLFGGQRYLFDFNRIPLVPKKSAWQWLASSQAPTGYWTEPGFQDPAWREGQTEIGFAPVDPGTFVPRSADGTPVTLYLRKEFTVREALEVRNLFLNLRAQGGVVVYLNGEEVWRDSLPDGRLAAQVTGTDVYGGAAARVVLPVDLSQFGRLLHAGVNVLAAEVHQTGDAEPLLGFSAELAANQEPTIGQRPTVGFLQPMDSSVVKENEPFGIYVEARDPDGEIGEVEIFVDGVPQVVKPNKKGWYAATWEAPASGQHRLTAVVHDQSGMTGRARVEVSVFPAQLTKR